MRRKRSKINKKNQLYVTWDEVMFHLLKFEKKKFFFSVS